MKIQVECMCWARKTIMVEIADEAWPKANFAPPAGMSCGNQPESDAHIFPQVSWLTEE